MGRVKEPAVIHDATAALRASGFRVTPQRLAIHETLLDLDRHVSAEEVLGAVSDRLPNVSLPTVYSALVALEEAGLVRRVAAGRLQQIGAVNSGGPDPHQHFAVTRFYVGYFFPAQLVGCGHNNGLHSMTVLPHHSVSWQRRLT